MKSTDFSKHLSKFFKIYLVSDCNLSENTINSYSYTFSEFLKFMKNKNNIEANKIKLENFNRETIQNFLRFLGEKGNTESTINQRQAAINSFCKYLRYEEPGLANEIDLILSIKRRKCQRKSISYMKVDGMNLFLKQIDTTSYQGLRDFVMMSIMLTTGVRVSELINIKVKDVQLSEPATIKVFGKGRKERIISISPKIVPFIKLYIEKNNINSQVNNDKYMFMSHLNKKFTRHGVGYIVAKYRDMARSISPDLIPDDISCHKLRHSCGVAMVNSGLELIYLRDILGHESVETTQMYAGTRDSDVKKEALDRVAGQIIDENEDIKPIWNEDIELVDFLNSFKK